jgi:hypothetical protein
MFLRRLEKADRKMDITLLMKCSLIMHSARLVLDCGMWNGVNFCVGLRIQFNILNAPQDPIKMTEQNF